MDDDDDDDDDDLTGWNGHKGNRTGASLFGFSLQVH